MSLRDVWPGPRADPPGGIDDAAACWVARRRLGTLDAKDQRDLARWLEQPAHRAAFSAAEGVVEGMGRVAGTAEIRSMRDSALAAYPLRPRWRSAGWALVAMVALLAIGAWIGRLPGDRSGLPSLAQTPSAAGSAVSQSRHATGIGEQREIGLDDGSVVALNTDSAIVVDFSAAQRSVRLLRGQALFEVAADAARPFVVTAGDRRITAVGTAFDVRVDAAGLHLVMVEGRVDVDSVRRIGLDRLLARKPRISLGAGEQLHADAVNGIRVSQADVDRAISWREGRLIFRNDPLESAVAEVNRYSRRQLVIEDPRLAGLRISGVFSTARPDNFVLALSTYHPVVARPLADGTLALVRSDPPEDASNRKQARAPE
ncbi:FecR family protein [Luteimonas sp. RIT-PG2_3]